MSYQFDDAGSFESKDDAIKWARRNGYRDFDFRTRDTSRGVNLELRRDAKDDGKRDDYLDGRRTGFF